MNLSNEIIDILSGRDDLVFEYQRDVSKFSTMKAKSHGSIAHVKSEDALAFLLKLLKNKDINYKVIGWGANFILPTKLSYILIKLDIIYNYENISNLQSSFIIPANVSLPKLTSLAMKYGFSGWEVFTGIPASLGGAVYMNAGTSFGEIGELIKRVWIMNSSGEIREYITSNDSFSYRKNTFVADSDIIIKVEITHKGIDATIGDKVKKYLSFRQETQPLKAKTCGCMFKNQTLNNVTCPAGLYLDIMGLKGFVFDSFRVNPKHANFLENYGDGNRQGLIKNLEFISRELYGQYGVVFEEEIHY